ncbi:hypothetical protein D3C84_983730 [compost metagenome]
MAFTANGAEVHEDVIPGVAGNEAEAFGCVEPLHGAGFAVGHVLEQRWCLSDLAQVDGQVKGGGQDQGKEADQDGGVLANDRQWREEDQCLQDHRQDQQRGDQALQLVA